MKKTTNVFLVGPMGAGKTTIGRRLARTLKREFIDSDKEIERRTGADIALIFEKEGETGFRAREKNAIAGLTQRQGIVLATGGGAVLDPDNRRRLVNRGFVVYLSTSVDEQLRRTCHDTRRPLLKVPDPRAKLETLLTIRDPLYREVANIVIRTDGQQVKRVVNNILRYL